MSGSTRILSGLGEVEAIRLLCGRLSCGRDVLKGPGDDCAVVRADKLIGHRGRRTRGAIRVEHDLLLTSDPVIEGVHFKKDAPPAAIGHKAIGRVLSDIAAMGGIPLWALVDVVAPDSMSISRLTRIYSGLTGMTKRYGLSVLGGDLSRGPVLELHVFCAGMVSKGRAVLRSGARPGHKLFVTGALGGSGAGRHLRFEPRLEQGRWLARSWASAMIDISDGLASDIRRINEQSGTGAQIILDKIPLAPAVLKGRDKTAALRHAFVDGEDFELLFTVPAAKAAAFKSAWRKKFRLRCNCIGVMTAIRGRIECVDAEGGRTELRETGYEHFGFQRT